MLPCLTPFLCQQIMQFDRPKFCVWLEAKLKVLPTKNAGGVEAVSNTELAEFHKAVTQAERTKEITRALVDFSRFFSWQDRPARWGSHLGSCLIVTRTGEDVVGCDGYVLPCHGIACDLPDLWPWVVNNGLWHFMWFFCWRIMKWQLLRSLFFTFWE